MVHKSLDCLQLKCEAKGRTASFFRYEIDVTIELFHNLLGDHEA